jgi:hypothetical protein
MLHIAKLCVGIADIADLRRHQAARLARGEALRHLTRSFPRRAPEVTDGGSIYWVIAGAMAVRQRILDIEEAAYDDGSKCAALVFDAALLAGHEAQGSDALPAALRRELEVLGLL